MGAIARIDGARAHEVLKRYLTSLMEAKPDTYTIVIEGQVEVYEVTAEGYRLISDPDMATAVELPSNLGDHTRSVLSAITENMKGVFATCSPSEETIGSAMGNTF